MNKHHTNEDPIVETTIEARQGDRRELNKRVLFISTLAAALVLGLLAVVFAL